MVSSPAGFRIGVEFNGNDGTVTYRSSDGSTATTQTFTPGTQVTMGMNAVDAGTTAAGQTASITLVPVGADMQLGYTTGATDFNGDLVASLYLTDGSGDYLVDGSGDYLIGA